MGISVSTINKILVCPDMPRLEAVKTKKKKRKKDNGGCSLCAPNKINQKAPHEFSTELLQC